MTKLLYIESSPRKARSKSIMVAKHFLDTYRAANPGHEIVTLDLWNASLPDMSGDAIDGRYQIMRGQAHTPEQAAAWSAVEKVVQDFKSADKYVISLPMWNFGVPYKLKQYIDVIAQPGLTFSFSPDTGYRGLVTGKPVAIVYARGGAYGSEQTKGMDFQKTYLEMVLGFIGFTDIRPIVIEPTLGAPEDVAKTEAAAIQRAKQIASSFA